jgi:AraC family transcriptional regulator, regulatory protein of adaptative response / methylated-DNA-[protein]-cysteine methyltransferase
MIMKVDAEIRTPSALATEEIQFTIGTSSLGAVLVARSAKGICAVLFGDDRRALRRDLQRRFPGAGLSDGDATLGELAAEVIAFVESPTGSLNVPIDMRGTELQRKVWQALREIPAGSTVSYSDIANRIGVPGAAHDVAEACAANALAVVVPCHRVIRKDGTLSGYRWGIERKRTLLEREAVV